MPTYYIDFEGGDDAKAGTSFSNRWQTITNGATAARIAPGDEIRVMASPDPTSIGSATWTGGGRPDAISIVASSNATPIVVSTPTPNGLVTGDYVVVVNHATNTNANGVWRVGSVINATQFQILQIDGTNTTGNGVGGVSGSVTKANNLVVETASPLVQNVALCGGLGQKPVWTASTNVTTATTTANKEGGSAMIVTAAAAFTTGKAAYYTLPSTLDLSAYQQVSFWIRLQSGTLGTAGQAYIALCTDTIGNTVAHQCNIPAPATTGTWFPVTVNLGTNLNAAIRSVALYIVTDLGAQTFYLDNIVACKAASSADSITLQSLVSKSDGTGDEAWYAIQSINYDVIMLANANTNTSQTADLRGYNGATEAVTTYKRETVKTVAAPTTTTNVSVINDSGTAGSLITYSGGWNRTDMSTQTGQTWLDGQNGLGRALSPASAQQYVSIDKINFCRYGTGFSTGAASFAFTDVLTMYATANTSTGISTGQGSSNITFTSIWANNNGGSGIAPASSGIKIIDVKLAANNSLNGILFTNGRYQNVVSVIGGNNGTGGSQGDIAFNTCNNIVVETATLTNGINSTGICLTQAFNCFVNGGSSTGHAQGVFSFNISELNLNNFTINESIEVSFSGVTGLVYSNRHDNTDNNSWIWQAGVGEINQQTAVVDSPATTAWRMRPTSVTTSAAGPVFLKLGTVVCAANSLVTVTARMQRSNTGLTMRLACPGGQISGVTTDVTSDMTAAADTWETVTITFTPTKAGGVDIYAQAFGGSTYSGYVCNLTASQA